MTTPMELVQSACPKIGSLGSAHYFDREITVPRGKELGLDGFRFYFLGRGGVLGDVEARVVRSAFGYAEAPAITDEDRAKHNAAEDLTDQMVLPAYAAVDEAGAAAILAGLSAMEAALAG